MKFVVQPSQLSGSARVPGSKSHTIRGVVIAALARGESELREPLDSLDTRSCVGVCRALGASVELGETWRVAGTGGELACPEDVIDVGNSGTTLRIGLTLAALGKGWTVFTGDEQIRRRPAGPLLEALRGLGAEALSTRDNGCAPFLVRGPLRGGRVRVACPTSQYLTSLLIGSPLAEGDVELEVTELNEAPYVEMTLGWLDSQGIRCQREGLRQFRIPGGQSYEAFETAIPGDFSSATFFAVAAAITGSEVTLQGLDREDTQGDKAVLDVLAAMGAEVTWGEDGATVRGGELRGGEFDLNAIPDALPSLAVAGCFAEGETRLVNVPQARIKETDRIRAMREELTKMGARVEELPEGLILHGGGLSGTKVHGRADHRVVMALAVAGLAVDGETEVETAEAAAVTCPSFVDLMTELGARIERDATV